MNEPTMPGAEPRWDRPLLVYLHRYPPEVEANQYYSGMREMVRRLADRYRILYASFRSRMPADPALRRCLEMLELPGGINIASPFDKLLKTAWFFLLLPWLLGELRRRKPALIIVKEPLPLLPTLVCMAGVPVMIDSMTDWWWRILLGWCRPGARLAGRLERWEARRWDSRGAHVVVQNRAEAGMLLERGMSAERVHVINTTMPDGLYFPCDASSERRALGYDSDAWVVAVHGTIRPGKGYSQLLHWWQRLASGHPSWRLLIIGGAGGITWCRRLVRRLGLHDSVKLTGWLPSHVEVNRHLNAADCLLAVRSNSEDNKALIPSALYHNLSTGKPTVATGLPGMAEVIRHGVDGYLFEPDNFNSFQSVLEHVAGNPGEAGRVGDAGIKRARECFDTRLAAERHLALVDKILGGGGKD